jgi:hypothetical protein
MIFRVIAKIFYIVLLAIETIVSIRFVFKLIGASGSNRIVRFVYETSDVFIEPFRGVVSGNWELAGFYIDVDALLALAIYMILAFVTIEIIKVFSPALPD